VKFTLDNNPDSCDIFQPHWVLDVYPNRPVMESCSLHEFLGQFEKEKCSNKKDVQLKLKALNYTLRRRKDKQYTVTHQRVNPRQSHENKELHFYPWFPLLI